MITIYITDRKDVKAIVEVIKAAKAMFKQLNDAKVMRPYDSVKVAIDVPESSRWQAGLFYIGDIHSEKIMVNNFRFLEDIIHDLINANYEVSL